jgi:hypothetical protein
MPCLLLRTLTAPVDRRHHRGMSVDPVWLDGLVGTLRCAACGRLYARRDLRTIGDRDEHWFIRCTCGSCASQGIAVVTVEALARPAQSRLPSISVDDVLSAHELLREYRGNVDGLFGAGSPQAR